MNLDDGLDRIRHEVPNAPHELMVLTLRDVIRDFCRFTRAWRYEVTDESVFVGVSDYEIELPGTYAYPIAIEHMELDSATVFFKTVAWLDKMIPNWRLREADDFRYFTQLQPLEFTFPCVPTRDGTVGGLSYRVSCTLTEDATEVEDVLADEFIEAWSDGAKARLRSMPGKPWTDLVRSQQLEGMYRAARGAARIHINNSRGNAEEAWSNPRGFA